MANEFPIKTVTPIVFADSSFVGAASGFTGGFTDQLNLASLDKQAARQSAKADLGALRAARFLVRAGIEFDVAPDAGLAVQFYWSSSFSGTDGIGNDGGASGSDSPYKAAEEEEWLGQLIPLGNLKTTNDASTVVQVQSVGILYFPDRYGQLIVYNDTDQSFETGDAFEMFVAFIPIIDESQ